MIIICLTLFCLYFNQTDALLLPTIRLPEYEGQASLAFQYQSYNTSHFWNKKGKRMSAFNHFHQKNYSAFAEYGLTDCDSLGSLLAYSHSLESLNGNSRGLTDIELYWKHLLLQRESFRLASQIIAIVPPGHAISSIRYGKFGSQLGFLVDSSVSLFGCPLCYFAELGYRWYSGSPSDQLRGRLLGAHAINNQTIIYAIAELDYGLFNGESELHQNIILFNNNYRLLKGELQLVWNPYCNYYASIAAYKHFWGQNVGTGGGFSGSLWALF